MPYKPKPRNLLDVKTRKWAYVPVLKCKGPGKFSAYTIIQAKTPPEWGSGVKRVSLVVLSSVIALPIIGDY